MQTELKLYTNVKLPAYAIEEIKKMAEERFLPTRTMLRVWIMERLKIEQKNRSEVPVIGGVCGNPSPITGEHTTQEVGAHET